MNFLDITSRLYNLSNDVAVFMYTQPEILDFTKKDSSKIFISGSKDSLEIELNVNEDSLLVFFKLFQETFVKKKVIGWNIKSALTYVLSRLNKKFDPEIKFIDLKLLESFLGVSGACPRSFSEAIRRLSALVSDGKWERVKSLYNSVHVPLFREVIPALEVIHINSKSKEVPLHACYEIEGQNNGRLKCSKSFSRGYVPHTLGEERIDLMPRDFKEFFIAFDIKHMEVSVLGWLSRDGKLKEILSSDKDVYKEIYELLTGEDCLTKEKREWAKKIFLPVIYGQQSRSLASQLSVNLVDSEKIIDKIRETFPTAISWIEDCQQSATDNGFAKDYFGRIRYFQDAYYRARNFVVQAPAAILCEEMLIRLYRELSGVAELAFSVHDGYFIYVNRSNWLKAYKISYKCLTEESNLCEGLSFKVRCRGGKSLNEMKPIFRSKGATCSK